MMDETSDGLKDEGADDDYANDGMTITRSELDWVSFQVLWRVRWLWQTNQ